MLLRNSTLLFYSEYIENVELLDMTLEKTFSLQELLLSPLSLTEEERKTIEINIEIFQITIELLLILNIDNLL